jgi:hypothetical protein
MRDYRVIRMKTGESYLCIVDEETHDEITFLFPLVVNTHTIPVADNVLREIHSTTVMCPFTEERHFMLKQSEISFTKPMGEKAITYYIEMLNTHEEIDTLKAYSLHDIIEDIEIDDELDDKTRALLNSMEEIENETDDPTALTGNKTLH